MISNRLSFASPLAPRRKFTRASAVSYHGLYMKDEIAKGGDTAKGMYILSATASRHGRVTRTRQEAYAAKNSRY